MTGRARIAQVLDVIAQAKQQDGYEKANGFAFEPSFRTRIGGGAALPRSGTLYEKSADHGVVSHTIYTGFSESEFLATSQVLAREAGFSVPQEVCSEDGCRQVAFANGVRLNFMPFRHNGVSITLPDAILPALQQFQQAGRAPG